MQNIVTIWQTSKQLDHTEKLMSALRQAGLPLAHADAEDQGDVTDNGRIVCIASVTENMVDALIAIPSGLVYLLEDDTWDMEFWKFAAENYYLVTGNLADRLYLAERAGADPKSVKGKAIMRAKSESLSTLSLDNILADMDVSMRTSH